jgi:hypothetical protein
MASTPLYTLASQNWWEADGVQTVWNFSFAGGYIDRTHVKAWYKVNPEDIPTPITVVDSMFVGDFQLLISPAIAAGATVCIYRDTPKILPLVDFTEGSGLSEVSLDTNAKQAVFIAAELQDTLTMSMLDASGITLDAISDAAAGAAATLIQGLKDELAAPEGAGMIGYNEGTVQDALTELYDSLITTDPEELFIQQNFTTINQHTAIAAGKNGSSIGPMTIADGASVSIPTPSRWIIF